MQKKAHDTFCRWYAQRMLQPGVPLDDTIADHTNHPSPTSSDYLSAIQRSLQVIKISAQMRTAK